MGQRKLKLSRNGNECKPRRRPVPVPAAGGERETAGGIAGAHVTAPLAWIVSTGDGVLSAARRAPGRPRGGTSQRCRRYRRHDAEWACDRAWAQRTGGEL
jgi:hypothetical protein